MDALIIVFFLVASAFLAGSFRKLHQRYQDSFSHEMRNVFLAETLSFLVIIFLFTDWSILYILLGILNIIKGPFYWNAFRAINGESPVRFWAWKLSIAFTVFAIGCVWLLPSGNDFLFFATSVWYIAVHIPAIECFRRRPKIHTVSPLFMLGFMLFSKVAFLFTITIIGLRLEWSGIFFCLYCMANLSLGAVGFMVALGRAREEYESKIVKAKSVSDQLNQQLKSALDKAKNASRAKDEFLGIMSHELRTPISGIIGMASVLKSSPLNDEQHEFAWAIEDSGKDLLVLVEQILDFSRYESGKILLDTKTFSSYRFMDQVVELLGGQANRKGLEVLPYVNPSVPNLIDGDEAKLRQVLINLLNNAIKFTESGHISVTLSAVSCPDRKQPHLECRVKDTGPGIAAEDLDQLFTPFFQADTSTTRKFGGAGLGLAISKRLMVAMGGDIVCESTPGYGAEFVVTWPLERPSGDGPATHMPVLTRLRNINVWVIHQHEVFGEWIESSFKEAHLNPQSFSSVDEAIQACDQRTDDNWPHVVVLDEDSLASGHIEQAVELLHDRVHASGNRCKLIVRSAHRFQSHGNIDGILRRPCTPRRLMMKLDQVLQKSQNASASTNTVNQPIEDVDLEPVHHDGCSVLVVEDHPINQKLAVILLKKLNCRVTTANHGVEALECIERQSFDIILMDLHMPMMDGFETARQMLHRFDESKQPLMVALTAAASTQDRQLAKSCGLKDFLLKPIQYEQLEKLVERCKKTMS